MLIRHRRTSWRPFTAGGPITASVNFWAPLYPRSQMRIQRSTASRRRVDSRSLRLLTPTRAQGLDKDEPSPRTELGCDEKEYLARSEREEEEEPCGEARRRGHDRREAFSAPQGPALHRVSPVGNHGDRHKGIVQEERRTLPRRKASRRSPAFVRPRNPSNPYPHRSTREQDGNNREPHPDRRTFYQVPGGGSLTSLHRGVRSGKGKRAAIAEGAGEADGLHGGRGGPAQKGTRP